MSALPHPPVEWDYTALAAHYDKRADYADSALQAMLELTGPSRQRPVADIGAGTGKLTRCLLARGYPVCAVEPNGAMREIGIRNTAGGRVAWSAGTGEETGLPGDAFDLVAFGSSFNVTDRQRSLAEAHRLLRPGGWFACMWNHRDLANPLQALCEQVIRRHLPRYDYGSRRQDQSAVIRASGLFEEPRLLEGGIVSRLSVEDFVEAWRSHGTLQRQAGEAFERIVEEIREALADRAQVAVPYTTRIWCARRAR